MQASQRGPSFLDLQLISGTDVEGASSYFTFNSFGYMVGALVAGYLYDKLRNKLVLVCVPMLLAAFFIGLTPWCTSYITMMLAHLISASQCSITETIVTAEQFYIWGGKSDAAMQFLGFTFSLGGVLGPLYTEPFLLPKWNETDDTVSHHNGYESTPRRDSPLNDSVTFIPDNVTVFSNVTLDGNQTSISNINSPPESELYYAYMITGFFGVLFSIPFFVMFFKNCIKTTLQEKNTEKQSEDDDQKRLSLKAYVVLTALTCVFLFSYSMIEDLFTVFLPMFLVSHLSWTKEDGALVSSLYWGIGTICKLVAVPVVRRIDMGIILLTSCVLMVISTTAFLLASHYHINILVWMSSSVFSVGQSLVYGGCFSWVDTNIFKLDGKATSVTMVFSACGTMVGPLVLGVTMDTFSFMVFPYIQFGHCVLLLCYFVFMLFFLKPYVSRKYGPVRPENNANVAIEEKEKMVSGTGSGDLSGH